jgi:hypothetical protein
VSLLALGKLLWRFKDLEDQINIYHQQWQSYHQKHIIAKMAEKFQAKQTKEKGNIVKEIITFQVADAVAVARAIMSEEEVEITKEAEEDAAEEETPILSI